MQIKHLVTAGIFTILAVTSFSQDGKIPTSGEFKYTCGEPYPVVDAAIKSYAAKDGNVISFKMSKEQVVIQKFSGDAFREVSNEVYEDFPKGTVYEDDLETEDYVYLLFSVWDRANETEQLYVRKINLTTGAFEDEGKRIIAVSGKVTGGNGNKFRLATSFDNSKLLLHYRKKPESRNSKINKDNIGLYVFDSGLTELWGQEVEMPYTEARMNNIDYTVDKDGNVFILSEVMNEGETRQFDRENNPNFTYQIISVSGSGVQTQASDIDVQGKFVTQVSFFEGQDDKLLLAGFYSNKRGFQVDGIFYCSIGKDARQNDFKSFEIPTELLKQFTSERSQKRMDKKEEKGKDLGMTNMVLRDLIIHDDGSIFFAGEKYYVITTRDSRTGTVTYDYYYEEMLAAKIDKNGELIFIKKLPKRQHSDRPSGVGYGFSGAFYRGGSLSYKLVQSKDNYYILFLDNVKNLELDENKVPARHEDGWGGFLTAYQISKESGDVKKLSVIDTRDAQGYELHQFATQRIIELGKGEFALECYIKKKLDIMIRIKVLE
ncbi:hypothetical protein D3C87_34040 [compost metagenome]